MTIRVLLADDQDLIRESLAILLSNQDGIDVVGQARNGREAIELARALRPDVVLMDARMPVLDGVAATRELTSDGFLVDSSNTIKVIILTTYNVGESVKQALRNGASGFALKDRASVDLVAAINAVAAGDAWLDPAVTMSVIDAIRVSPSTNAVQAGRIAKLTPREREVLASVALGQTNSEIAAALVLSGATVKTHINRILMKLGVHDRAQAVTAAYEFGLVKPARNRL